MEYPNLHKRQKIEALELGAMRLEDDSVWRIEKDASLPSQEVLSIGDNVAIEPMGPTRPGEEIKSYKVVKDPKKQGFKVSWVNQSDKDIKKSNDIIKGRKGTIDDKYASESSLDKNNPDEWLGQDLEIEEVRGDDDIVVADKSHDCSEWGWSQVSKDNFKGWVAGQTVRISKSDLKPIKLWMKNLENGQSVSVSFIGVAKSKL